MTTKETQPRSEFDSFRFLKLISKRLIKYRPVLLKPDESSINLRLAAVAVILRMRPTEKIADEELHKEPKSVEEFLSLKWVKTAVLEILYIKRAINERDNWSGDVAFPGGRQDKGELLLDTAKREALEEVGIDLRDTSKFITLGRLNDCRASSKVSLVSPFVFLQICPTSPKQTLQTSEVAGSRWIPLSFFVNKTSPFAVKEITWERLTKVVPYPFIIKLVGSTFAIDKIRFPGIILPDYDNNDATLEFLLWGLTMRITADLLTLGGQEMLYRSYTSGSVVMDSSLWVFDVIFHQRYRHPDWQNALAASAMVGTGLGLVFYMNKAKL